MFRVRDDRRRKRAARIAVESLEDRVVLTAAAAAVEIQYLRAINHLNTSSRGTSTRSRRC